MNTTTTSNRTAQNKQHPSTHPATWLRWWTARVLRSLLSTAEIFMCTVLCIDISRMVFEGSRTPGTIPFGWAVLIWMALVSAFMLTGRWGRHLVFRAPLHETSWIPALWVVCVEAVLGFASTAGGIILGAHTQYAHTPTGFLGLYLPVVALFAVVVYRLPAAVLDLVFLRWVRKATADEITVKRALSTASAAAGASRLLALVCVCLTLDLGGPQMLAGEPRSHLLQAALLFGSTLGVMARAASMVRTPRRLTLKADDPAAAFYPKACVAPGRPEPRDSEWLREQRERRLNAR